MNQRVFEPAFGNRPSYLVGREGVIDGFVDGLHEAPVGRGRSTLLLGQRGSGKTVLLWEFADRARECGFVVATPTICDDGMLERIVEKVQDDGSRYAKEGKAKLVGGSVGALGFSAGLEFEREVQQTKSAQFRLTQLCRRLTEQGHGVLILIDEVQAMSAELRQLVAVYQELVGQRLDVALVMAGLPAAVSATLNDHVLTFLNRSNKVELEALKVREVDSYYALAFRQAGIEVPDDLRLRAAQATKGSPYMLQLVGYELVLQAREGSVDEDVFNTAIAYAQEDFENDVCKTTLAALSDRDVDFLRAMAVDEGPSRIADIADRMGVTTDYAQKYRRRLLSAGVIEAPRRGMVAFAVPYLADFLRAEE